MRTVTSHPSPARSGGRHIQFLCMATARSSVMSVPKNPEIISGPCASASEGVNAGNCQPRRISPAQSAKNMASMARKSKGI